MLNFELLEKYLGIVSPPNFVYDFSKKIFLMLYSPCCIHIILTKFHCLIDFTLVWNNHSYVISVPASKYLTVTQVAEVVHLAFLEIAVVS